MAQKAQRTAALLLAGLFLFTSVATTVAVIYTMTQDDKTDETSSQTEGNTLKGKQLENFKPISDVAKLEKIDIKEGTGEAVPTKGATITAHYTGAIAATGL